MAEHGGAKQRALDEVDWPIPRQAVEGTEDGPLKRLEAWCIGALMGTCARLPDRALDLVIAGAARIAFRFDRRHREAGRRFLEQALGTMPRAESDRRLRQAYAHFFRVVLEPRRLTLRVPEDRILERFDIEWTEDARRLVEERRGCILVTPHLGSWELTPRIAGLVGFAPVYGIAKPVKNRPLSIRIQRERETSGVRLMPRRGAMVDAVGVIRAGGAVGMLVDQRARKRPVLAPFFGRPARCDRSVGVLVKRLGAPILMASCLRTDEPLRWRVRFYACFQPEELRGESPVEIAARLNRVFERMILDAPEQYFWLHDRYKDTPAEFPDGGEVTRGDTRRAQSERKEEQA